MAFQTLAKEATTELEDSAHSTESNSSISQKQWLFLATFGFVFAAACLLIFCNLGAYPLFNPDEALYAEPAREMLETGEYITTLLNYAVRFTKPPLVIWAMAGCYKLFGVTEFAARYFGAACGAILVAATYLFTRAQINGRAALIAAFALLTAPLFLGVSREAITDIPLSLFVTGSMMCLFYGFETEKKRQSQRQKPGSVYLLLFTAYASIGLAVMTKGPIGLILPIAILGTYHLLKWNVRSALAYYKPWFGLPLVALIAVPWFAIEIAVTKGAYYREFILRENFQRFTGVVDHKAAWWYHIAAMFGGFFPWTVFLPGAFLASLQAGLTPLQPDSATMQPEATPVSNLTPTSSSSRILSILSSVRNLNARQSTMLFATLGSVIILGFFSAGVSKLIPYTLPAFPLLAVLVGGYVDELWSAGSKKNGAILFATLTLVYTAALAAIPVISSKLHDCPPALLTAATTILVVHALGAALASLLWLQGKFKASLITFILATYAALLTIGNQGMAAISNQWEAPIQSFAQFAGSSDATIVVYQMRKPSVTFYAGRRFLLPKSPKELAYILSKTSRAYIISRSRGEADLKTLKGTKHLCQMGQYVLTSYIHPGAQQSSNKPEEAPRFEDKYSSNSDDQEK